MCVFLRVCVSLFRFVLCVCVARVTFSSLKGSHTHITGWRRPIGCFKLQDIFRKRATNYRALWREMTYKDKASYGSSPPFTRCVRETNRERQNVGMCV